MRRAVVTLFLALACATAHAEKRRQTAQILSSVGASVSGAVVIAGFVSAPDAKPINEPVMYTGIGMLFVTPSLGQFYAEQYLTVGMGVRALAVGFAIYTLETQTTLATCDTAHSSNEPPCEIFSESAYPLLGIAALGFIGGVWYDALDAGDAVDRWNRKHQLSLTPAVPTASGPAPGLSIGGVF